SILFVSFVISTSPSFLVITKRPTNTYPSSVVDVDSLLDSLVDSDVGSLVSVSVPYTSTVNVSLLTPILTFSAFSSDTIPKMLLPNSLLSPTSCNTVTSSSGVQVNI